MKKANMNKLSISGQLEQIKIEPEFYTKKELKHFLAEHIIDFLKDDNLLIIEIIKL